MAKKQAEVISFRCFKCGVTLKVGMELASRYVECGKCKNRVPVPANQKEADEERNDIVLKEMAMEVPARCTKCNTKMPKGAVVCVECGFSYKEGKPLKVEDFTVKEGEEMRGKPARNAMIVDIVSVLAIAGVAVWRLLSDEPAWWEVAFYIALGALMLFMLPMHIIQMTNYSKLPRRLHAMTREEDRWEREEARSPFGHRMFLVAFLCFTSSYFLCLLFMGGSHWDATKEFITETVPGWFKG